MADSVSKSGRVISLRDVDTKNQTVFLRLDLNIPSLQDDFRIREALPTLLYLQEQDARIVIASHFGRPKGPTPEFSLEPIASHIAVLLKTDVTFLEDVLADGNPLYVNQMKPGSIAVLENLRFYPGEEKNDPDFCRALAKLGQIYITDAFGTTHRKHASTYGVAELMPTRAMGFLIERELKFLDQLLTTPKRPFYVLLGGSKVSDKIKTIENLLTRVQGLAIGGAMAFAFLKAEGKTLPDGAKQPASDDTLHASAILKTARARGIKILLPEDFNDSFDIGPNSIEAFKNF